MKNNRIYLDYASLTPTDPAVLTFMSEKYSMEYANPSSVYEEGVNSHKVLDESRDKCAKYINAHKDEIYFTSGGTESNNIAILGFAHALHRKGLRYEDMHFIASSIEHSSIMECMNELKNRGSKIDFIEVDTNGVIDIGDLRNKIKKETVLVSIMAVNNETGTIQPIKEIAKEIRHARKVNNIQYPLFHSDCSQAIHIELNMENTGIDLVTVDSAKTYGPKGVGMLYIKRGLEIDPIILGGGQESGLRSGTENIPGIAGFSYSLELIKKERNKESVRLQKLKNELLTRLIKINSHIKVNGAKNSSPHILNISIPNTDCEFLVFQLDAIGIACSTKSSCLKDKDESYVLRAMDIDSSESIRFSFGRWTKKSDIVDITKAVHRFIS